eukprot:jgi/Undpi1/6492/HiC_scaffold_20.g08971.m1
MAGVMCFWAASDPTSSALKSGATLSLGHASWGTFLVFTSHGQGRRAREALEVAFSPSSVLTVAHNRRQGGCFMVHASAAAVDSLLLLDRQAEGREVGLGQGRKEKQGDRERGGGEEELFQGGSEEGGGEKALALRWRREWSATNLDLHGLSFWSHTAHQMGESAGVEAGVGTGSAGEAEELLVREWGWAARTVHALALRRGVSPAEACGWNDVRVAAESDGRITVREIGHLLPEAGERGGEPRDLPAGVLATETGERERMACLMGLILFLASRPEAARVSALPRGELANEVATRIVQGASETRTPLWDRGVDGSGQVVQVVDSGLAEGSCYFRHSASSSGVDHGYLKEADGTLSTGDMQYDLSRRKVVQYIEGRQGVDTYGDDNDGGHGSHVSGSVAGSIYPGWSGPADCPWGVGGAGSEDTELTCVGKCLSPSMMEEFLGNNMFDLDAFCPEYECDIFWDDECLSDDRTDTLENAAGMAPGARLAVLDVGSSTGLDQVLGGAMWETSAGTGARLHSGSWGYPDEPCVVDEASVSFDQWAYENPEHLLVFAAGNRGDDMSGCSIVSPALGKNALAVGSSMSGANRLTTGGIDNISAFSSQGPTPDGRIKPDVLAPGHFIFSVSNGGDGSCELGMNSGTSMSCPVAAGAAALVRQYFDDGYYAVDVEARGGLCSASSTTTRRRGGGGGGDFSFACESFSPSGALVKAMLIHGANAMGGSTDPDGERGFGRVHLESAMPFDGEDLWALYVEDNDGSTTGVGKIEAFAVEDRGFVITEADAEAAVEAGSGSGPGGIRVTLVWMDPPATAASSVQLVHDLDLYLEGPDGTLWTTNGVCGGGDESSCSLDDSNNVERIVVPASDITSGTWTARVSAANDLVEGGPQSYALVVSLPISAGSGGGPSEGVGSGSGGDSDGSAAISSAGESDAAALLVSPSPAPTIVAQETPEPTWGGQVEETPEPTAGEAPSEAPRVATDRPEAPAVDERERPVVDATDAPEEMAPSVAPVVDPTEAPERAPSVAPVDGYSRRETESPAEASAATAAPEVSPSVDVIGDGDDYYYVAATDRPLASPVPSVARVVAPSVTPVVAPSVAPEEAPESPTMVLQPPRSEAPQKPQGTLAPGSVPVLETLAPVAEITAPGNSRTSVPAAAPMLLLSPSLTPPVVGDGGGVSSGGGDGSSISGTTSSSGGSFGGGGGGVGGGNGGGSSSSIRGVADDDRDDDEEERGDDDEEENAFDDDRREHGETPSPARGGRFNGNDVTPSPVATRVAGSGGRRSLGGGGEGMGGARWWGLMVAALWGSGVAVLSLVASAFTSEL